MSSTLENDPRVIAERGGFAGLVREYGRRLREGDVGQLPVLLGLVVIAVIFQLASNGRFLVPFTLVNLTTQMAASGTIAVGLVLVLLLGEIDLSAGVVSGMCGAVMTVALVRWQWAAPLAIGLGVLTGMGVGLLQGAWITGFGIPSFVVTLAGLLTWQGGMLYVLGSTGAINIKDGLVTDLANTFFTGNTAYALAAAFVLVVAGLPVLSHYRRQRAGLAVPPTAAVLFRAGVIAAFAILTVVALTRDRGIISGLVFLVVAVIAMDFILRRTRFGRMIYAIGGNAEAARRAGIPVKRVRMIVFMLASTFAAWGGILSASRSRAAYQSSGGGDVLLNAIAAVVIGGTSLFGGRGSVWSALLGIIVIQSISSGMDLLSLSSSIKAMVTGGVLLATVTIDAVLRRNRQTVAR